MDPRERFGDSEEALRTFINGRAKSIWTALPGIIQTFNAGAMTAQVQPAVQGQVRNQQGVVTNVNLPLLLDVPVQFPGGGGYDITFPVAPGDECLVVFSSRCIDNWWYQSGVQPPAEHRFHDLSDGFAILGFRSQPRVIPNVSTTTLQVRSDNYTGPTGTGTCVEVGSGKLQLIADEVVVHGRNKTTFDAGGTGFVYTPSLISTYTDGVASTHSVPTPPEVPT